MLVLLYFVRDKCTYFVAAMGMLRWYIAVSLPRNTDVNIFSVFIAEEKDIKVWLVFIVESMEIKVLSVVTIIIELYHYLFCKIKRGDKRDLDVIRHFRKMSS